MITPPVIEGFDIVGLLGQGGMATVWKARQRSVDRLVAIKVLSPTFSSDPEDIRRFCEEARAAAHVSHSGIVQAYDASFSHGLYFVMELINGYTIGQWQRRKGFIPLEDALTVAENVAVALDYAWRRHRMIHCDIKPDNIMVDSDGTVKVADLGLSRTYRAKVCVSNEVLGTPHYMAPEQIQGHELDCRADIYAMGATLYHILTGRFLFDGEPVGVLEAHIEQTGPSLRRFKPEIPVPVALLIEKMLSKYPRDRQQDWRHVIGDVHRIRRNLAPAGVSPACVSSMGRDAETEAAVRSLGRKILWKRTCVKTLTCGGR